MCTEFEKVTKYTGFQFQIYFKSSLHTTDLRSAINCVNGSKCTVLEGKLKTADNFHNEYFNYIQIGLKLPL